MTTYGDMVAYLRSNLKTYKSEAQLWTIVNGGIADIMRRIDVSRLVSKYTFNTVATSPCTNTYTLPATVRKIISVTVDGEDIPGRSINDYREYMTHPEVMGSGYESNQSFIFVAGEIRFFQDIDSVQAIVVNYYPRHAYVAVAATQVPVDCLMLIKYLEARVALMSGDMKTYQVMVQEYMASTQDESDNEDDNMANQRFMKNAYPSTSQMLSDMSGGY